MTSRCKVSCRVFLRGNNVPALNDSLRRVAGIAGVRTAALLDAGTGMVIRSAGDAGADFAAAAANLAEEYRAVGRALGPDGLGGELEQVAVVTASRFQVLKVLDRRPGDGLLLHVNVDRAQTNIALADLQISQAAPAVLA